MTDVKELKPIEAKGVDLGQFEGQRAKIESVEVTKVRSNFGKDGDGESDVLKVQSVPLTTIEDRDGKDVALRASELFNLTRDENGALGWPTGPNGKLAGFMKKLGVSHPAEVIGKEVVVGIRRKEGTGGMTREFLGFNTD